MPGKHTIMTLDSALPIPPMSGVMVTARPQIALRPYRCTIEPELARFFQIDDIRVGQRSAFPWHQSVPASMFATPPGLALDAGDLTVGLELYMHVRNLHRSEGLVFRAHWNCLVIPPSRAHAAELAEIWRGLVDGQTFGDAHDPYDPHNEHLGTRLQRTPEVSGRPEIARRDHPGFGWDPFGDE